MDRILTGLFICAFGMLAWAGYFYVAPHILNYVGECDERIITIEHKWESGHYCFFSDTNDVPYVMFGEVVLFRHQKLKTNTTYSIQTKTLPLYEYHFSYSEVEMSKEGK